MKGLTLLLLPLALAAPAWPQNALSLPEAVAKALSAHPSAAAAQSGVRAAESRIRQARAGAQPKVNYAESWQAGDNPVFVFGTLLTQRQFAERNFALKSLNNPDAVMNFQSLVAVEHPLYDAGATRQAVKSSELGRDLATEEQRRNNLDIAAHVVRTYYGALLAAESERVAAQAVKSAEASLQQAQARRDAGVITDADVLSIRVHLAAVREQQISRRADHEVARAALSEALGVPLDTQFDLTSKLTAPGSLPPALEEAEREGVQGRPEIRQTQLSARIAESQAASARAALYPQISARAAFEADRQRFVTRAGANWFAGVSLKWNLFDGNASRARIDEANHMAARARAMEQRASNGVRLEVRSAHAGLAAAAERVSVAQTAVAQAEESLRITRNRYESGLATVTDLLRNETAVLEAGLRHLGALHDLRLARVAVELAAGRLSADSEVLK